MLWGTGWGGGWREEMPQNLNEHMQKGDIFKEDYELMRILMRDSQYFMSILEICMFLQHEFSTS